MKKLFTLAGVTVSAFVLLAVVHGGLVAAPGFSESFPFPLDEDGRHPIVDDRTENDPAHAAVEADVWYNADSHKWIGEKWDSTNWADVTWVEFDGRKAMQVGITYRGKNWAFVRTDSFPPENWEDKIGLRAYIYQAGGSNEIDVKLQVRGPGFDDDFVEEIPCVNLQTNAWNTCTWLFTAAKDYGRVSHISLVLDSLEDQPVPTFYVDNLTLLTGAGGELWDSMDGSWWYYSGNFFDWNPNTPFGLEPVTHNGENPTTPPGSVFLQWDHANGVSPTLATADVGLRLDKLGGQQDWSGYNRIVADVKVSDPEVPVSAFLWDSDTVSSQVYYPGFASVSRGVGTADMWTTVTWDLPSVPWFDKTGVDEVKFIVNNIDTHQPGTLYVDNVRLISDPLSATVSGLAYVFEDFNDRHPFANDFNGNWGVLNGTAVSTTFVTTTYRGSWGASLRVDYDLPEESFAGVWQSLWGHSDFTRTQYLDFTDIYGDLNGPDRDFEQITFWVRGSGLTTATHNVKVELKDTTGDYGHTAYRYVAIDDSDTTWRQVVLNADVTDADSWVYNLHPPDPTRMKQLVFVIERSLNNQTGTFYLDDIHFVDADASPFDLDGHTDDEFLDFVSERTFMYFLDWYDPNTGLFQDRSTFPDLMSTAATGFGLTALTIGESRGWIDRPLAVEMITRTLYTLRDGQAATDTVTETITGTNGYRGFYYHFLGVDGLRKGESELSSVDTALLLFGVLTVREYFSDAPEIVDLADELYGRVQWDWMLDPEMNWFYLAWKPECDGEDYTKSAPGGGCFTKYYWNYYTDEVILINLLAIGSPTHPVPLDTFYAWEREIGAYGGHSLVNSWNGSFFTYVFAHLWIDFYSLGPDNHFSPTLQVDWWNNSVEAAKANWQFAVDHHDDVPCDEDDDYTTYSELSWGPTAAEGPDGNYHAYGALPKAVTATLEQDGTIAPYGAGSAIMLLPVTSTLTLKNYFSNTDLWRYRFGFGDAYNLDPPNCGGPWYNHAAFGIDQGPMLIAIENYRSGLIWETMARNEDLSRALGMIFLRLTVSKSADPVRVRAGSPVTYALSVANACNFTLTATITDSLPNHIMRGRTSDGRLIEPGGVLTWTPPALAPGSVWTQTLGVTVEVDYAGLLTNVVQATTEEGTRGTATCVVDGRSHIYLPLVLRHY
jgi:hypothetical protein